MNLQQLYTNCLAQGAYYVSSNGEAAIVDPLRETGPYLDLLRKNGDKLKYVFETHFHADFVSGHVDLAAETGATIVFGPGASTTYSSHVAKDGEVFRLGNVGIRVLHTPGHTPESSCFLLYDEKGTEQAVFTGDTLFIGDVGRPDLAIKSDLTQEDLAGMLYDSLRDKIMPLPDHVIVYPAHGAGSACGKNMSKETSDTLGNQKKTNYALSAISRQDFIKELTTGILPPPQYFAKNAALNKDGYKKYSEVMSGGMVALSPVKFDELSRQKGTLILDVRKPGEFATAHLPGSVFIGLDGQFAPWVGAVIPSLDTPILLVAPAGREEEAVMRLSRVGYDNCRGYLEGGVDAWAKAGKKIEMVESITADEFMSRYRKGGKTLDVRKPGEFESGHLAHAQTFPLDFINQNLQQLEKGRPYLVHCQGGYRSMIAVSLMKAAGVHNVTDVQGGYGAISKIAAEKEKEHGAVA